MLALSELFTLQRRVAMLARGFRRIGLETDGRFVGAGASFMPSAQRQECRLADGGRSIA